MKKKILLITIVAALVCLVFGAAIIAEKNRKAPVNTSRRDGQVVDASVSGDEDLEAVIGEIPDESSIAASEQNMQSAKEREEADSALYSSLESIEATKPTTAKVDSVNVLLLPESVTILKGDSEAFYGILLHFLLMIHLLNMIREM